MNEINAEPGIYQIFNKVTGVSYIGQSNNVSKRIYNHKRNLKKGKCHNNYLQDSYKKHGVEAFEYRLVQNLPVEFLTDAETYWMNYFTENGGTYNFIKARDANTNDKKKRGPMSDEHKLLRRLATPHLKYHTKEAKLEVMKERSAARRAMFLAAGLNTKGQPYRTAEEISKANSLSKMGEKNPMHHSKRPA